VTQGEVSYEGRDLLAMDPEERAREGVFMAFQYPVEIPGVNNAYFLKAALNAIRTHRGQEELDAIEFMALMREKSTLLEIDPSMLTRSVNEGFSGGEKKRNEIFQMAVLEPKLAILDETDSGLDIDALKLVANGVNAMRSPERAFIVVTHYQRLLDYIVPDVVHVLSGGRIVKSGDRALALELEDKGYGWLEPEAAASPRSRKAGHPHDSPRPVQPADRRLSRRLRSSCHRPFRDGALMAAESAPKGDRALRRCRISDDARRGMEVHQRRADRRPAIFAGARRPERPRDGSGGALGRRTRRLPARAGEWRVCATVFRRQVAAGVHVSSLRSSWPRTRRPWSRISAGSPPLIGKRSRR
jgi:Fe-S cluster assembly ATP-binding protein